MNYTNWLWIGMLGLTLQGIVLSLYACGSSAPQLQVENPVELCATGLAMVSSVKVQAAKLGIEPHELARRTCDAAILAAQVTEANLVHSSGIAGATSLLDSSSMTTAGAGGVQ